MFWRRRRDKGEDEAEASRSERGREGRGGHDRDEDAELEAELAADREAADYDEPAGDAELDAVELATLDGAEEGALENAGAGAEEDAREGAEDEGAEPADSESGPEPEDMSADLEAQAREFLADNDVWMYGENAPAVIAILDRIEDLTPYDAEVLVDLWQEVSRAEREIARKAVKRVTEADEEAERRVQLIREAVGNWVAVTSDDPKHLADDVAWPRHAAQAGEAAIDAATALVLRDDLDEADFESLHGPWAAALEQWEAEAAEAAGDEAEVDDEADEDDADDAAGDGEFGPNTRQVKELLNRLWLLPGEQVSRLVSNWEQTPRERLQAAHEALHDLVEDEPDYRRQIRRAQEELQPWLNTGRRVETSAYLGRTGSADTHSNAGPALADAVAALVVGDLLDPDDAETLYAPWFKLVGAPPLPEPAPFEDEVEEETAAKEKVGTSATGPKQGTKPSPKPSPKPGPKPAAKAPSTPAKALPTPTKGAVPAAKPAPGVKPAAGAKPAVPAKAAATAKPAVPAKPAATSAAKSTPAAKPGPKPPPKPGSPARTVSVKKGKHRR